MVATTFSNEFYERHVGSAEGVEQTQRGNRVDDNDDAAIRQLRVIEAADHSFYQRIQNFSFTQTGSIESEIDRLAAEESGASLRARFDSLENITSYLDRSKFLREKQRVCEDVLALITRLKEENTQTSQAMSQLDKHLSSASVGSIRNNLRNRWAAIKLQAQQNNLGGGLSEEGRVLARDALNTAGRGLKQAGKIGGMTLAGGLLLANLPLSMTALLGSGAALYYDHQIRQRNDMLANMKKIEPVLHRIKAETIRKHEQMFQGIQKEYKNEIDLHQWARATIRTLFKNQPARIEAFERAVQENKALNFIESNLAELSLSEADQRKLLKAAELLDDGRGRYLRAAVEARYLAKNVYQGSEIGNVFDHLKKIDTLTAIRGKQLSFQNESYILQDLFQAEGADHLMLRTLNNRGPLLHIYVEQVDGKKNIMQKREKNMVLSQDQLDRINDTSFVDDISHPDRDKAYKLLKQWKTRSNALIHPQYFFLAKLLKPDYLPPALKATDDKPISELAQLWEDAVPLQPSDRLEISTNF